MTESIALVRRPSRRMADGIVTHIGRAPVDADLAARQHAAYVAALADAGWTIREVAPADELPDSAFVEDTVVVCGDLAVLARPGAPERRAEVAGTEEAVARARPRGRADRGARARSTAATSCRSARPSTSGRGGRTNGEGIRQLRRHVATRGRTVVPVPLHARCCT